MEDWVLTGGVYLLSADAVFTSSAAVAGGKVTPGGAPVDQPASSVAERLWVGDMYAVCCGGLTGMLTTWFWPAASFSSYQSMKQSINQNDHTLSYETPKQIPKNALKTTQKTSPQT